MRQEGHISVFCNLPESYVAIKDVPSAPGSSKSESKTRIFFFKKMNKVEMTVT